MTLELLGAVKGVARLNDSLCKVDDNDLHMELSDRFSESLDTLEIKLSATIAEFKKRREESPWKGPFMAHFYDATGTWAVIDDCKKIGFVCEVGEEAQRVTPIIAALNAFHGYGADGRDMLEGL